MIRVESSRVKRRGGARAAAAGGKGMSVKGEKLFSLPVLFMPLWEVRNKLPAMLRMMVREGRPGEPAWWLDGKRSMQRTERMNLKDERLNPTLPVGRFPFKP